MNEFLKVVAPGIASLLGGPLIGMAVSALGGALGVSEPTQEKIEEIFKAGTMTPEQVGAIKAAEVQLKARLAELGVDMEKLAVDLERVAQQAAESINKTMQAEAQAEHWPTYSWRPAIGLAVAVNIAITSLVVATAYAGIILFEKNPESLSYIPAMIGSMALLIGAASPILGIASWFRGRMQSNPEIPQRPQLSFRGGN